MAEIWKPVPSFPGILASSEGRILLAPLHAPLPNGGYKTHITKPVIGTIRSAKKGAKHKYRGINIRGRGTVKVHRLVCEAFHGPPPFDGAKVLHSDENGLNNHHANLSWGTQKQNLNAPGFISYCRTRVGHLSPRSKWAAKRSSS